METIFQRHSKLVHTSDKKEDLKYLEERCNNSISTKPRQYADNEELHSQ